MPSAAPSRPYHPAGRGSGDLRPFARPTRLRRRLSHRLACGLTPAQAARAEGVEEAEVTDLLAQPDFAGLVEAYRSLASLPEAEARQRLIAHARFLLEEAMVEGDVRAAMFVLRQENRGRDPAASLADGVLTLHRRAAAPPPPRPQPARAAPPSPRPPAHPAEREAWRVAARLREALLREHATEHAAAQAEPVVTEPEPAAVPPAPVTARQPNRLQRRRQAALERRVSPRYHPHPAPATAAQPPERADPEPSAVDRSSARFPALRPARCRD